MSRADARQTVPRAMIHRRILDVAETNPDATLDALADEVSGASPTLVERVLDEYGDPANADATDGSSSTGSDGKPDGTDEAGDVEETEVDGNADDTDAAGDADETDAEGDAEETKHDGNADDGQAVGDAHDVGETETGGDGHVADGHQETVMNENTNGRRPTNATTAMPEQATSLSEKQRQTLRMLYEHPEASQGDIADALGVTRPTVSRRLNSIEGFEWSERRAFARSVFDGEDETVSTDQTTADGGSAAENPETDDVSPAEADDAIDENGEEAGTTEPAVDSDVHETLGDLDRRLSALESDDDSDADGVTTETAASDPETATVTLSPELAHKVVHACMNSERVSEDEEMELLRSLMQD